MSNIQVSHLTFGYEGNYENVFEDVSFTIDTDWKLGLIGRKKKKKTTLLNLLLGKYTYQGTISKNVEVSYFPYEVKDKSQMTIEIVNQMIPMVEDWQIIKELSLLHTQADILYRSFDTLSGGEQVKILLATLFLKENNFLLIDEPTNHLDIETRTNLIEYLKKKKGFILVSHDRKFLDEVIDHIIAINNTNIEIQKGNFSSWKENKDRQEQFEITQNEKLKGEIRKLEKASKQTENWSNQVEKMKIGTTNSGSKPDKGYIGHQAAKMMKRSKVLENRYEKKIEEKAQLLNNIDRNDSLTIKPLISKKEPMILFHQFQIEYDKKPIFTPISFAVNQGDRIAIIGKNGSGKSSILKCILGQEITYQGEYKKINDLKISYVSQNTDNLKGNLTQIAKQNNIDESIFKAMLAKMGFTKTDFERDVKEYSEGQKKKVLLAKSITESAHIYVWDEPLNYIDILTKIQIEEAILKWKPTMIFVEHDEDFVQKVSTQIICIDKEIKEL